MNPPPPLSSGSVEPPVKGLLDRILIFRAGLLRKRVVTFFEGGYSFYMKNKLKSEIFNDKKSL